MVAKLVSNALAVPVLDISRLLREDQLQTRWFVNFEPRGCPIFSRGL